MLREYDDYRQVLEKHLLDYMPQVDAKARTIFESMRYSLLSGGKRLRPVLLLASCDFAGGDIYEALPFACALEYIHTYSLIHDDLPSMDNDDFRRGNPTNHKVYGDDIALLAGDGLLNTACEIMFRDLTYCYDDDKKLRRHISAGLTITKAAGVTGMIAGQLCDVENIFRDCSTEMLDFIDANKTGKLIDAAIAAGLAVGGASNDVTDAFAVYSSCLGKSFQISDDILDATGDEKLVGKKTGKDSDQGKCSYVVINGLDAAEKRLHELTDQAVAAVEGLGEDVSFFTALARKLEKRRA